MLLHKTTREALGIQLRDNVVIIDEAHNLIDTVTEIHSSTVSLANITRCRGSLFRYLTKYQARLKGKNIVYLRQLLFILDAFIKCLQPPLPPSPSSALSFAQKTTTVTLPQQQQQQQQQLIYLVQDFLVKLKIDNINVHKIIEYLQISSLAKKLNGFIDKYEHQTQGAVEIHSQDPTQQQQQQLKMSSPLFLIEPFLQHLVNNEKDGRVLISKEEKSVSLRYLLLNPCSPFADIVKEARSVIMAGGTMQPVRFLLDSFNVFFFLPFALTPFVDLRFSPAIVPRDSSDLCAVFFLRSRGPFVLFAGGLAGLWALSARVLLHLSGT